jgi:methanogenic corrinoid protein MtbC1
MNKTYSISFISNACGVKPHTIRTWERRYKAFSPERTDGGQRIYSEDDLIKGRLIVSLLEQGQSISRIAGKSLQELRTIVIDEKIESSLSNQMLTSVGIKKLLTHLSNFDLGLISSEMLRLRLSIGAKEFIFKVLIPIINAVEKMYLDGKYSVTQEHIISTIIRYQLSQINLPDSDNYTDCFIIATPEGNLHELPILIADILCQLNRISTYYIGAGHPAVCLSEAVNELKSETIVLGVVSSDKWVYEKNIIPFLKLMDKNLTQKLKVILGGGWKLNFPEFKYIEDILLVNGFKDFDYMLTKI